MPVHIANVRVRPKKAPPTNLCAGQLSAMLGCWAATKDLHNTGTCAQAAQDLFHCMRVTPKTGKVARPSINYHLAKLKKITK
ncbi:hypothetical protein CONPUDRAFT_79919 [Coniophora puteana RWD-64-598 SS2]|uniref:37S ribosomal protein mrp10, mitochondrial n=1 Tax=Coniophora puteana (strain RWD-64-598) TaxID=741705 RepID=A0A5M3N307_CONPW|nr:uncharacterized protein CONPUDRAFT_79919 [Coniophora puteana RWD-64-598 SS2]EIW85255.1 hypothetical protein CONPUDRAFT_79919 [Coniophora puteana RWD-64-598 SS2]